MFGQSKCAIIKCTFLLKSRKRNLLATHSKSGLWYLWLCQSVYTSPVQSEILEKSLVREMSEGGGGGGRGSVSAMDSLHHSRSHPTSASAIEQLQSLLKQKEGELANAQVNNTQYHIQVVKFYVPSIKMCNKRA